MAPRLSPKQIKELQNLLKGQTGKDYTDEEAQQAGLSIMRFVLVKMKRELELKNSDKWATNVTWFKNHCFSLGLLGLASFSFDSWFSGIELEAGLDWGFAKWLFINALQGVYDKIQHLKFNFFVGILA